MGEEENTARSTTITMPQLEDCVSELRDSFRSGRTRTVEWRRTQLKALLRLVEERQEDILLALHQDLGKPRVEAFRDEIATVKKSIALSLSCLDKWMKRKKVRIPLLAFPTTGEILPEPLGLVLVFSSWNFPFVLAVDPLVGAIAAGNTVVLKPSELSPATSSFLADAIPLYLDRGSIKVFQGGESVGQQLLEFKWDHIFFTGGQRVGRIVMGAAAKHLTPVTLELGGKCPAIVDTIAGRRDREVAIKRIVNAKWGVAGGQACIAVDYLLVQEDFASTVIELMKYRIRKYYGEDPRTTKSMTRIVNTRQFQRLVRLMEDPRVASTIVHGGQHDQRDLFIEPTILLNPPLDSELMTEEIFGPLLPIITVQNIEHSIDFVNTLPKPLAIYGFTKSNMLKKKILSNTSSGSVTFNDAVVQFLLDTLPFGGVGASGFGRYHGKFSFDTFSHEKAVLRRNLLLEFSFGYPPWNENKLHFIRSAFKYDYLNLALLFLGLKK